MAKVRSVKISFKPSGSPDVVGYKMYYNDTALGELNYNSPFVDLGNPALDTDGKIRVDIAGMGITDGTYDIGIVAVDDAGNESSMDKVLSVPFDFVAPDAPTETVVERI